MKEKRSSGMVKSLSKWNLLSIGIGAVIGWSWVIYAGYAGRNSRLCRSCAALQSGGTRLCGIDLGISEDRGGCQHHFSGAGSDTFDYRQLVCSVSVDELYPRRGDYVSDYSRKSGNSGAGVRGNVFGAGHAGDAVQCYGSRSF